MRLFPILGSLTTASGRTSFLAPPFSLAPNAVAGTILEALRVRFAGTTPLAALVGTYRREMPERPGTRYPCCIMNIVGEEPVITNGKVDYPAWLDIQFNFIAEDDLTAEGLRDAAHKALMPVPSNPPLEFADGNDSGGRLWGRKWEVKQVGKGPTGKPLWIMGMEYRFYITRSMT